MDKDNKFIFVSKLIFENVPGEISLYINSKDFKFCFFMRKQNFLIPYRNEELEKLFNNNIFYNEIKFNDVKKKVLANLLALGILGVTLTSVFSLVENADYVISKKNNFIVASNSATYKTNNSLVDMFETYLNKNENISLESKKILLENFPAYLNDWGYLFNEDDIANFLVNCSTVKYTKADNLVKWAGGDYNPVDNIIRIRKDFSDGSDVFFHEFVHASSDHGITVGTAGNFGLGYALNEGITSSISEYYYRDDSYAQYRSYAMLMERLVGKEVLMKGYISGGIDYIIQECCAISNNVNKLDVIKLIAMMDVKITLGEYRVQDAVNISCELPKNFDNDILQLYDKIFFEKYQKHTEDDVLTQLIINNKISDVNFLNKDYVYSCDGVALSIDNDTAEELVLKGHKVIQLYNSLELTKEDVFVNQENREKNDKGHDLKISLIGETDNKDLLYCHLKILLLNDEEIDELKNSDPLVWKTTLDKTIEKKYGHPNLKIEDNNESISNYISIYLRNKLENQLEPGIIAADLRYDLKSISKCFISNDNAELASNQKIMLDNAISSELKDSERNEIKEFYYNTDLSWKKKDYMDPSNNHIKESYNIYKSIYPVQVKFEKYNYIIVNIPDGYEYKGFGKFIINNNNISKDITLNDADYFPELNSINTKKNPEGKTFVIFAGENVDINKFKFDIKVEKEDTYTISNSRSK